MELALSHRSFLDCSQLVLVTRKKVEDLLKSTVFSEK